MFTYPLVFSIAEIGVFHEITSANDPTKVEEAISNLADIFVGETFDAVSDSFKSMLATMEDENESENYDIIKMENCPDLRLKIVSIKA